MTGGWHDFQVTMNKAVKTKSHCKGVYDAAHAQTLSWEYTSVFIDTELAT